MQRYLVNTPWMRLIPRSASRVHHRLKQIMIAAWLDLWYRAQKAGSITTPQLLLRLHQSKGYFLMEFLNIRVPRKDIISSLNSLKLQSLPKHLLRLRHSAGKKIYDLNNRKNRLLTLRFKKKQLAICRIRCGQYIFAYSS